MSSLSPAQALLARMSRNPHQTYVALAHSATAYRALCFAPGCHFSSRPVSLRNLSTPEADRAATYAESDGARHTARTGRHLDTGDL